jgi:hypothetical protein
VFADVEERMPVFSKSTKVNRTVADPGTDDTLPPSGALSWGAITAASGVAGTTGADVKLIHGDLWERISGSVSEFISGSVLTNIIRDHTLNVTGNRMKQITGNHTENIVGNQNLTVIGPHNALYVSPKNDVHASPHNRVNSSPENQQEPSQKIHILGVEFEKKESETTVVMNSFEIKVLSNEITAFKNEATGLANGASVIVLDAVLGISIEPKISEVNLEALHTFLKGAEAKAGGGSVAAMPRVATPPNPPANA